MITESCAIRCREPCQVLTEAALSGSMSVPQGCPEVATCLISSWCLSIEIRVRDLINQYWAYQMLSMQCTAPAPIKYILKNTLIVRVST